MLSVAYKKKHKLKIIDSEVPEINKDEALIKVNLCGVCGSDLVKIKNDLVPDGTVLGHEVVGTIVNLGKSIKNWSIGQKIVLAHHVPCMGCHFCRYGNFSMCHQFKNTNFFPGGFSEYIKVSKNHMDHTSFLIPKGTVSDYEISLTEPLACCLRAIQRAEVTLSNYVLISGLGSIGIMLGKLCSQKGAKVFGFDLLEERVNLAQSIDAVLEGKNPNSPESDDWSKKVTDNKGFDIVFLASGSDYALDSALKYLRPGGKILVFSSIPSTDKGYFNNDIYYKELNILGSYSPSPASLKEAYQMIITGKIKLKKIISDIVKLETLPNEINKCFSNQSLKMIVEIE